MAKSETFDNGKLENPTFFRSSQKKYKQVEMSGNKLSFPEQLKTNTKKGSIHY